MSYTITITRPAQKQLAKIEKSFAEKIIEKIFALSENPRPSGCKKLQGRDSYRIRIGDYRVIYEIMGNVLKIVVIDIDHRKQVYR